MKYFAWSAEKNEQLRTERNISFDEIVFHIENGDLIDEVEHPNLEKYPHQRMFIVRVVHYVFLVPYVLSGDEFFLKTIIPNRKATRLYLGDNYEETET